MNKEGFCGTNDLIPGKFYYGVGVWRNIWCYLGRNSNKEFVWFFVSSDSIVKVPTVEQIMREAKNWNEDVLLVTKSTKRVKPMDTLLEDPDTYNYIYATARIIAENKIRIVNIEKLTQKDLDKLSNLYKKGGR